MSQELSMERPTLHSLANAMNFTGKIICMAGIAIAVYVRTAWCKYKHEKRKENNKERIEEISKAGQEKETKSLGKCSSRKRP